jgi:ketosteroid isomerase-like protein
VPVEAQTGRTTVEDFWRALERKDLQGATDYLHDRFVEDWPQSGERIRGKEHWLEMVTNHPTFPTVKLLRVRGSDDLWAAECDFDYPGTEGTWRICALCELRDGKIAAITEYFGAPFEPAEWRSELVERISR